MSSRKRRRNVQKTAKPAAPLLPPDVGDDEIDISDEDLSFVARHRQYAGFLSGLDTSSITKQVLGIKSSKKEEDNLESYYEKRAKLVQKGREDDTNLVDPADVLPIKTLSGELQYANAKSKSELEKEGEEKAVLNLEERKALVRRKTPRTITQSEIVPKQGDKMVPPDQRDRKLSKSESRKELKKAKRDQHPLPNRDTHTSKASSRSLALEELEQDLSEQQRIEEMKARMAELGTAVLADPENHLDSLTDLQGYCSDKDANVSSMAMLSLLAVFKDIVPGYRIRLPTQKELEMQVSKEVKKLRDFETKLLKCYQRYVQFLIKSTKSGLLRKAATRCVSGLLEAIPHFNFRDSLLSATIPSMNSADSDCRKMSCHAVRSLFLNEGKHGGSATVEAVEMIADLVKSEKCIVRPDVIQVLLSLSFDEDLNRPAPEQEKKKGHDGKTEKLNPKHDEKDKKAKKRQLAAKLREEVATDFRESCTMPEANELRRLQTQILTAVFETYFRILKASLNPADCFSGSNSGSVKATLAEYGPRPLLGSCLDGLAKFSHLVSVEFMADLLALLKRLAGGIGPSSAGSEVQDADPISFTDRLHCCVVAFKIVRSNLDALNIDLRDFYVALYNLLLCHKGSRDEHDGLVLAEALQVMLWESRQHDMQRVAAFIKRLAAEALHLGPAEAISALVTVRHLLQRYKKCRNLLENEDGGGTGRSFISLQGEERGDPDMSAALSSVLWEVSLLSRHYHPAISRLAEQISNMLTSSEALQASLTPKEAIIVYSTDKGGFNPSVQLPKNKVKRKSYVSHPLKALVLKTDMDDSVLSSSDKESSQMFLSHFKVLRDIKENEALRTELKKLVRSVNLFKSRRKRKGRSI
ncbi:hypothetical protein GOP47_0017753 [Adiantum capillus-veneris]|uniref:Nucleolar complex protein 3 homolog n=1 Tax=Adiantum capillus-veneris TaxID=13818 RepID=A0A9D4ZB46_ADICA|nr:hypothetical protein GOP47_0017753 [Adiantum capillus-veneris]